MGGVYRARDSALRREVAIKVLAPSNWLATVFAQGWLWDLLSMSHPPRRTRHGAPIGFFGGSGMGHPPDSYGIKAYPTLPSTQVSLSGVPPGNCSRPPTYHMRYVVPS